MNSFVPGRGALSGGFIHIMEVARRWVNYDVVVFAPEEARSAVMRALPTATFNAARSRGFSSLATAGMAYREIKRCDIVVATTSFLADVLPTAIARRGRGAIVVQHVQTPPWKRPGSFLMNAAAYLTERIGFQVARRNVRLLFYNNPHDLHVVRLPNAHAVHLSHGVDHIAPESHFTALQQRSGAVYVGRLHPTKGLNDLIKAWKIVVDRLPSAQLRLVGEGSPAYRIELENEIATLGLTSHVELLGAKSDVGKVRELVRARAFAFPSYEEGWGIAIAEALYLGTPCITYDLEAYRDAFTAGCVVKPVGDIDGFAAALIRLLENDDEWHALSTAGARLARTFTWQAASDIYASAIDALVASQ